MHFWRIRVPIQIKFNSFLMEGYPQMTILNFNKYILKCSRYKDGLKGMCCIFNLRFTRERIAFAHFLQLAMVSFAYFLRFHLRTIFKMLA